MKRTERMHSCTSSTITINRIVRAYSNTLANIWANVTRSHIIQFNVQMSWNPPPINNSPIILVRNWARLFESIHKLLKGLLNKCYNILNNSRIILNSHLDDDLVIPFRVLFYNINLVLFNLHQKCNYENGSWW